MLTHQLQSAFEDACEKAAASNKPDDWMNAALLGKQFSNAYRDLSSSPASAWECASPTDARHPMAFVTTKRPTMEHYKAQGWTVTPLFLCPPPELLILLTTIERVRAFEAADAPELNRALAEVACLSALLSEARATLRMWKDVAPAVSLCADIDKVLGISPAQPA
ncbi:hypothetical protein R77567_01657 [Ralstonia sp. LMG 32965]|uniref:Uncharacterized protein n=1 Tax=Ralstonia flatus TaxID=3058601 RepID=A0AAD2C5W7_9RALS|nr:hypothetical protein [Ralstonia sp. LMG 32965]MBN6211470.1 hypothetical protein [Ralstonia pickettii]CAJ0862538.1 hypothetical protein R77567_01657 [Ralstonia sp. LMG 32965]